MKFRGALLFLFVTVFVSFAQYHLDSNTVSLCHFDSASRNTGAVIVYKVDTNTSTFYDSGSVWTSSGMFGTGAASFTNATYVKSMSNGMGEKIRLYKNFTLEFWFKTISSLTNYGTPFLNFINVNYTALGMSYVDSIFSFGLGTYNSNGTIKDTVLITALLSRDNKYHHVFLVRQDSTISLLIDERVVGSRKRKIDSLNLDTFYLGKCTGAIDEFRISNVARLAAPMCTSPTNAATAQSITPTLTWTTINGATSYRVQVSTTSTFTTTIADDSTSTTLTSGSKAITASLNLSSTYYWRVRAKSTTVGTTLYLSTFSFTTAAVVAPVAPTLLNPANGQTAVVITPTLTWGTVSSATTYRVQLSTSSTFGTIVADDSTLTAGSKAITVSLINSTTYYWRTNAKNAGGTSVWSSIWSFTTTTVLGPTLSGPINNATNMTLTPTLFWGTVSGATTYRVQLSTNITFISTVIDDSTLTSATRAVTGLKNSTTYYWRVNAKNAGGTSAWSSIWSFTTLSSVSLAPKYTVATLNTAGTIEIFQIDGTRILATEYAESPEHSFETIKKTLSSGCYLYKIHNLQTAAVICGRMIKP